MFKVVFVSFVLIFSSARTTIIDSETIELGFTGAEYYKPDPGTQNETLLISTFAEENQNELIETCSSQKSCQTEPNDPRQNFYVITAIFNPASFQRRYALYHQFVAHMEQTGAKLITIECIFPSLGQTEFEITNPNNSNHIQIESKSVYWVKENLINIAVSRLPESAEWVAWIDADVFFQETDWVLQAIAAMEKYSVVQLFKYSHFLDENDEILLTEYSFGYAVANGKLIGHLNDKNPHPGYGWAMSKSTFLSIDGLPIYDIVGMGDLFFAYSLINHVEYIIEADLNYKHKYSIFEEVNNVFKVLSSISHIERKKGIVGFAPLVLSHKWHGARKDRGYMERTQVLIHHNFNYWTHMKIDTNGMLVYIKDKNQGLETDIGCYFESRNEDSKAKRSLSKKCDHYKSKYLTLKNNQTLSLDYKMFDCILTKSTVMEIALGLTIPLSAIALNEKFELRTSSQFIIAAVCLTMVIKYQIIQCISVLHCIIK